MSKRYPITMMCGPCIPWTDDFQFDEAAFRTEVKNFVDNGVKSIFTFGTAGEGYALSTEMFTKITKVFLDECSKGSDIMPMTGIISTSMMEMIKRIKIAKDLGCKDFQIALPCWGALTDDEVINFFKSICGQFPDCRFMHYNNGLRSKKLCTIDLYVKLAKEVPNLVAAKYSTPNMFEIFKIVTTDCPITFFFIDHGYVCGAMLGECALIPSYGCINFELAWKHFYAGQGPNIDHETLAEMYSYVMELNKCFNHISPTHIDAAYDKSIERVADPNFNNSLYPPYIGLSEEDFDILNTKMLAVKEKYIQKLL